MELFATETHFILVDGEESLWIDRLNGRSHTRSDTKVTGLGGAELLGNVYGYIGKLRVSPTSDTRLIFIRSQSLVGNLNNLPIYRISSVLAIPFEGDVEVSLEQGVIPNGSERVSPNNLISASASPTRQGQGQSQVGSGGGPGSDGMIRIKVPAVRGLGVKKMESKVDRRMLEEFHKMFTEAESFYYSPNQDITNSLQRSYESRHPKDTASGKENMKQETALVSNSTSGQESPPLSLWEMADTRFFWNRYMVKSLIHSEDKKLYRWILPIIQGFIQYDAVTIEHVIDPMGGTEASTISAPLDVWLISRRSRFQAGTRYLRRGVDEEGRVANYVESEQIVVYKKHTFSFVQVRGSIPVFWSQSNSYRYRPPPKIEREEAETVSAFTKHFDQELSTYERVVIVNLVEKGGKEKVLGDAYTKNVLQFNSPKIIYVSFDFHAQCRGMKFDNVSNLTNRLNDLLRKMGYCWIDPYGMVLGQEGVFRVNCVDCLDRTNVVQTHLAREMLTFELSKVGLIAPEIGLPFNVKKVLQVLWANNGDTLSKQYAGTNALKGDFTRTGERKFAGVMKDGMNSANRYYLNRFRDTSRQAAIDLMLGVRKSVTEADLAEEKQEDAPFEKDVGIEQFKSIIEDVKRCVIPPEEIILGAWGLVNGRLNEPDILDVDSILILTEQNYYVTEYDCDCSVDTMADAVRIPLSSVTSMELSFDSLPTQSTTTVWNIFSSNNSQNQSQILVPNLKINFILQDDKESHEFRSSNVRFFNTVAVPIQQPEEMQEALRMVSESIKIAAAGQGNNVEIVVISPSRDANNSNKARIAGSGMATNFVNKYLNTAQNPSADSTIAQKLSAASFDRLKHFRRESSGIEIQNGKIIPDEDGTSLMHESQQKSETVVPNLQALNLNDMIQKFKDSPNLPSCNPLTPNLPVHYAPSFSIENDVVLPSCGIVSPGRPRIGSNINLLSHISSLPLPLLSTSALASPDPDPALEYISSPINSISPTTASSINLIQLQHHRFSLPVNSFQYNAPSSQPHPPSRTPEITITEELNPGLIPPDATNIPASQSSSLKVMHRRISRSSEEVNKVGTRNRGFGFSIPSPFGGQQGQTSHGRQSGFKLPNIFQSSSHNQSNNKGSSQQNIFDAVGLKGSHSDNALKENQQKRDMVFAPLGKLAKGMQSLGASYLDPRKIRDSLKPAGLGRHGLQQLQDSVEDKELEQRKLVSETEFIEL